MKASVFIIESVGADDEEEGRKKEGRILTDILSLSGKDTKYVYIRTAKELRFVLEQFGKSDLRYLHLSCHGSKNALFTTLDTISFEHFGQLARPYLKGRRIFLSTCEATNERLAKQVIPKSGCYSVIGPAGSIEFGDAAIMWASFYHLMFKTNPNAMKRKVIKEILPRICTTFGVSMRYFASSNVSPFYTKKVFTPRQPQMNPYDSS